MKKAVITLILLIISFVPANGSEENIIKRFGLESGVIEYQVKGTQSGIETVYFDQWGMRESKFSKLKLPVIGILNTVTLWKTDWIYTIDFDKRLGNLKENLDVKAVLSKLEDSQLNDFAKSLLLQQGGKRVGKEKIEGTPCEIWFFKETGTTMWLWNYVPLQIQVKTKNEQTLKKAVKVRIGGEIPEEIFAIPENVKFIKEDINTIFIF